jgi:hypothetical protein
MKKISDSKVWSPAVPVSSFPSIPIQIKTESKSVDGFMNTEIDSITQFKPFLLLEEEDYFVI